MLTASASLSDPVRKSILSLSVRTLTDSKTVLKIGKNIYKLAYDKNNNSFNVELTKQEAFPKFEHNISGFFNSQQIERVEHEEQEVCSVIKQAATLRLAKSKEDIDFKNWLELPAIKDCLVNKILINDLLWQEIIVKLVNQGLLNPSQALIFYNARDAGSRYEVLHSELQSSTENIMRHFEHALNQVHRTAESFDDYIPKHIMDKNIAVLLAHSSAVGMPFPAPVNISNSVAPLFTLMSFFILSPRFQYVLSDIKIITFIMIQMSSVGIIEPIDIVDVINEPSNTRPLLLWMKIKDPRPEAISFFISNLESLSDKLFICNSDKDLIKKQAGDFRCKLGSFPSYNITIPTQFDDHHLWLFNAFKEFTHLNDCSQDVLYILLSKYCLLSKDYQTAKDILLQPINAADLIKLLWLIGSDCNLTSAKRLMLSIERTLSSPLVNNFDKQLLNRIKTKLIDTSTADISCIEKPDGSQCSEENQIRSSFYWLLNALDFLVPIIENDKVCAILSDRLLFDDDDVKVFDNEESTINKTFILLFKVARDKRSVQSLISAFEIIKKENVAQDAEIHKDMTELLAHLWNNATSCPHPLSDELIGYFDSNPNLQQN